MTCVTNAQTQGACPGWSFSALTNRITNTNFFYDAAGNLTQDGTGVGTHTYQYDAESRMITVDTGTTATYTYNALGQRVEKKMGTAYTEILYGASGEAVGEHNRTIWTLSVVPLGGRHLAHYNHQDGKTYFVHSNRLGSTSQVSDQTGAVVQDQLFYPYGQDWRPVGTMQEDRFARLGHRDTETSLDPTPNRMFASTQGHWLIPDSSGKVDKTRAQTWNRYTYAFNNPVNLVDRSGAWPSRVHDAILDAAFEGVLSNSQISVLQRISRGMDSPFAGGQDPVNSFQHGMCALGQQLGPCSGMISSFISSNLDAARANGLGTDAGLSAFGRALHTVSDMTSPSHTSPDGTPRTWPGISTSTPGHVLGERDTAQNLPQIGQAIRNEVAGLWRVDPETASHQFSSPAAQAQSAIESYARSWVFSNYGPFADPITESAARMCALGNPAACGIGGGFGGFGGGGGRGGGGATAADVYLMLY